MLVFGDPKFPVKVGEVFAKWRARLQRLAQPSLDETRSLLIFAGQWEQAISDCPKGNAAARELEQIAIRLTDALAHLFCEKFLSSENSAKRDPLNDMLQQMEQILSKAALDEERLTIKIPEGYAFYALFPEQYCVTASNWARNHANSEAMVVGIRSIGTSLSAVVKETLRQTGVVASRTTVRPRGHPFQRELTLESLSATRDTPVLIVDEGPGISGSSMVAVAKAFASAGYRKLFFFPGHNNEPGSASPETAEVWHRTPRLATPVEQTTWNRLSLKSCLLAKAQEFIADKGTCESIQNLSGAWQKMLWASEVAWPTSPPQFERTKFLCAGRAGRSVLWKFAGLHADADGIDATDKILTRLSRLARADYCPSPLGSFRGFIAIPWIEGSRLTRADADDASILNRVGNYLADAAQTPLTAPKNRAAIERLSEMLHWNAKESLGEVFTEYMAALTYAALDANATASYGDGHLAPHEWIRTAEGTILKLDAEGHSADHTWIGEQSVLWDIAGACIEWDLTSQNTALLLDVIEARGLRINLGALTFYRAAYAAFRVGLFTLGIAQISDEQQKRCFVKGLSYYQRHLSDILTTEAATAQTAH